jgi:hypothetical protein
MRNVWNQILGFLVISLNLVALWLFLPSQSMAASEKGRSYSTFKEWKREKVQEVKGRIQSHRSVTEAGMASELRMSQQQRSNRLLQRDLVDLDIANGLTLTDYIVGYLSKQTDRKAAVSAIAARLTPEEVAELMNAFTNTLTGSHAAAVGSIFSPSR